MTGWNSISDFETRKKVQIFMLGLPNVQRFIWKTVEKGIQTKQHIYGVRPYSSPRIANPEKSENDSWK